MSDFNHILDYSQQIHDASSQIVRKTAFDIQAHAQENARVKYGNMRASIYVVTDKENTYPGTADRDLLPSIDQAEDDQTAYTAVGASYGIYLEMGTSRMPAYPYLGPAAETVRPSFDAAMGKIQDLLKEIK